MELRRVVLLLAGVVVALALGLLLGLVGGTTDTTSRGGDPAPALRTPTDPASGLAWVDAAELPAEARDTLALIDAGGPFQHEQDGGTFHNREGLLPDRPAGYYREYTVVTADEDDRGPLRIVTGSEGEYYWTSDHYASFERIAR